jgi:hypothetical protein
VLQLLQDLDLSPYLVQLFQSSLLVFGLLRGDVDCLDGDSLPIVVVHALIHFPIGTLPYDLASNPLYLVSLVA